MYELLSIKDFNRALHLNYAAWMKMNTKTMELDTEEKLYEYLNNSKEIEVFPSGIKCDKCGLEMVRYNDAEVMLSSPPMQNVHCNECGHWDNIFSYD